MQAPDDRLDQRILDASLASFPLDTQPYETLALRLKVMQEDVISCLSEARRNGLISRICITLDEAALGLTTAIVLLKGGSGAARDEAAFRVEIRDHAQPVWCWIGGTPESIGALAERVAGGAPFEIARTSAPLPETPPVSKLERAAMRVLQADLPIQPRPFLRAAESIGIDDAALMALAHGFLVDGLARRFRAHLPAADDPINAYGFATDGGASLAGAPIVEVVKDGPPVYSI